MKQGKTILNNGACLIDSMVCSPELVFNGVKVTRSNIGEKTSIGDNSVIFESELKGNVSINRRCHVTSSEVGFGTYLNHNTTIRDSIIGKFCCISWDVSIGGKNHDYKNAALYTPYWWKKTFGYDDEIERNLPPKCRIGNDVWIGSGAIILRDVVVGDGAVIGAGAVVTKDVEPYTVVIGNPAKPIKKRFSEDIIHALQELKWWDWPKDVIKESIKYLSTELTEQELQALYRIKARIEENNGVK